LSSNTNSDSPPESEPKAPISLRDDEITTIRVQGRRSLLQAVGLVGLGAAVAALLSPPAFASNDADGSSGNKSEDGDTPLPDKKE